jgi:acyl-CoA-binding protein
MFGLANDGIDLMRQMHRWTAQQSEFNIVVTPAISATGGFTQNNAVITNLSPTVTALVASTSLAPQFWQISANGVPTAARVQALNAGANTITMNMEYTGNTTSSPIEVQFGQDTYSMPPDFDYFQNMTMWDRTNHWMLLGPTSPQADQWHRSGIFTTGPRRFWRKIGDLANQWRIWPPPFELANPLQLVFEYLSLNAVSVQGSQSNFAQYFANDTDQPTLNDQAIKRYIKYAFWQIKGFSYIDWKNDWIDYVEQLAAKDGGAKTLSMARRPDPFLISPYQVQDGNWPGPTGQGSQ